MIFQYQLNIIRILITVVFIQLLSGSPNDNNNKIGISSTDSLFSQLIEIEELSLESRKAILGSMGKNASENDVEVLIRLFELNKRSNAQMNQFLTRALGNIGDKKVVPILMEIALDNDLPIHVRSSSVEILSKKQAPELVDLLVEMLGDPESRDRVNEFAQKVMGDLSEEKMILAILEAYQIGRNKYYSLLNTVMNSLKNFENPKIKSVYKEIARTKDFPNNIRLKAFKSLVYFSADSGTIDEVIELLNDPENYVYYEEIITMLKELDVYENYQVQLRIAAYKAMQNDFTPFGIVNE